MSGHPARGAAVPTREQLRKLYLLARKLVARLHESLLHARASRKQIEHAREARVRLQQLEVILRRLHVLHAQEMRRRAKAMALSGAAVGAEHYRLRNQAGRIKLEIGIQAEAFYSTGTFSTTSLRVSY